MDRVSETYDILYDNVSALEKLIRRLNKKAAKLDVDPIVMTVSKPYMKTEDDDITVTMRVEVTVTGTTPKLNGWQFAATLQHSEEGNILRTVPGLDVDLPEEFRTSDPSRCDQCHQNRYRIDTYVVKHDDGRWAQVGSTCLKDFLGHQNPHKYAEMATWLSLIEDACAGFKDQSGWGANGPDYLVLSEALAWAAESVIRNGWVSRGKAQELDKRATADAALDAMHYAQKSIGCGRGCRYDKPCGIHFEPSNAAYTLAETALEWGRDWIDKRLAKDPDNDYVWNLRVSLAGDTIPIRSYGIAASLLGVYQRETQRMAEEKRKANDSTSEWIGKEGEKIQVKLTIDAVRYIDGQFGTTSLIKYHDDKGNVVNWFASGYKSVNVGDTVTVKGTVKKLDTYQGIKQTTLTRVKEVV
jgi:hypothetical protein